MVAGQQVFVDGCLEEIFRRNNLHFTGRHLLLGHDASDATKMVGVRMCNDHRTDGQVLDMLSDKGKARHRRLCHCQRINDDPPRIASNKRHVGKVDTADLVNALANLVEAVHRIELALTPQTRIDRIRCTAIKEIELSCVKGNGTACGQNLARLERRDEAPPGILEIPGVFERQELLQIGIKPLRRLGGGKNAFNSFWGGRSRLALLVSLVGTCREEGQRRKRSRAPGCHHALRSICTDREPILKPCPLPGQWSLAAGRRTPGKALSGRSYILIRIEILLRPLQASAAAHYTY